MKLEKKEVPEKVYLSAKKNLTTPEIPDFAGEVMEKLFNEADKIGLAINGPCEFIYLGCCGDPDSSFDLLIAIPIEEKVGEPELFQYYESPAYECVCQEYVGSMNDIGDAWGAFITEAETNGIVFHSDNQAREIYKSWVEFESDENITELQMKI
jgi:predicted transcriptional regulator YdeE